jgi:hypothetical protein
VHGFLRRGSAKSAKEGEAWRDTPIRCGERCR